MIASIIEWDKVLDVVIVSFAAGVGVTGIYAVCVLGVTRVIDRTRDGRIPEAIVHGVIAALAFAATLAAVVFGIVVMTTK